MGGGLTIRILHPARNVLSCNSPSDTLLGEFVRIFGNLALQGAWNMPSFENPKSSSRSSSATKHQNVATIVKQLAVGGFTLLLFSALAMAQESGVTHQNPDYPSGPPYSSVPDPATFKFRDLRDELRNKMTGTYTVSSTGDLFFRFPVSQRMSPQLRDVLRSADTTVGNLEGGMSDYPQDRAKVMADMGFDLLAPGEDDTVAGYETRAKYLAPLGIKVPGAGLNLNEARRPVFQEVPQGLVAFLHACPGNNLCGTAATNAGERPAKAGVNPLGLTVWNTVTAEQFNQLKAMRDSIVARRTEGDVLVPSALPPNEPAGRLTLNGEHYMVADKPGEIHYEVDPADEQAQVLAVRNAKEVADFVIFHMHVHQNRHAFQHYSIDNYPPDYLQPLVHKLIDNGLDMYFGSGNHTMQGIEIYKGRPIFYNQGNLGIDLLRTVNPPLGSGNLTSTERNERVYFHISWRDETSSIAYIASTTYKEGRLAEIRIYPVDIGLGKLPWSRENIPQTPTPERARFILESLQKYSQPFGTKISIENNIGVIRVPASATVDVGGDLVIPGRPAGGK